MITPSFSLTATERVLPKLALDFTTATLDARVTFTRTTGAFNPATYIANTGYVTSATDNQPRFDYDPVTLACKGLLIEESRTNNILYSQSISTSPWSSISASIGSTPITSPSGVSDAYNVIEAIANTEHIQRQIVSSLTANTVYTTSAFVKPNGRDCRIRVLDGDNVANGYYATYNLTTKVVSQTGIFGSGVNSGATIADAGNGWLKISVSGNAGATCTKYIIDFYLADGVVTIYQGNGTSGFYLWGAQLEVGAFPTSYIPTTSAALTRNADVATMTGTNFSNWWTATTGAATVSVIPKSISGTSPLFQADDNTADNIISLRGNAANPELYIKATTDQAQIDAGTIVANTTYKLSGAWNTNSCAAAQNGAAAVTDSSATIPTVTQARIGSNGTNYANAWLQKISYWPQRLINAEVQAFSK